MPIRRLFAAVAALSISALAGCGAQVNPAPPDPDGPDGVAVTGDAPGGAGQEGAALSVFAAASLAGAFDDLLDGFQAENPDVTIEAPVYDGSSTLVTQLIEGARADVLATANQDTMERLVDADGTTSAPADFATNTLVIAVPRGNVQEVADLGDVTDGELTYAVCARGVPCGAATLRLFEQEGLKIDAVSQEQNVTAVAQRVSSGEVDAGFVYTTDVAVQPDLLEAVGASSDPVVNTYPIATVSDSPVAQAFTDYVLSDAGRQVLDQYGFGAP